MRATRTLTTLMIAASIVLAACMPATTGGGSGGTTTTAAPSDLAHCPTPAAGQVRVAVVVDGAGLSGSTTSVVCVVVSSTATGITALAARAQRLGTAAPRYNASGLLCAIDGLPAAPACGDPNGSGFNYWSYWVGGSTWTYATVGPGSRRMVDGTVEGWRWVPGTTAGAPRTSASFATLTS